MKKHIKQSSLFLIAVLLLSLVLPTQLASAATVNPQGHEIDYNNNVPADVATAVEVAPNLSITAGAGELFSGGSLRFAVADAEASEKLKLPNGNYTLNGESVSIQNGVISIDGERIGAVSNSLNGDGKALQIDFDVIPVQNGDFSQANAQNLPVGWTINDANQIHLGNLASKTQGRGYTSVQDIGGGQYRVTGPGYSYVTDVDYSANPVYNKEGTQRDLTIFSSTTKELVTESGKTSLKIGYRGNISGSGTGNPGTAFQVEAWSPTFTAKQGDQLGFDWLAKDGGDDYEVYGFLVDGNGNHTELMYGRGKDQPWTTETGTISADGEYQFRFVAGSFDRTDGAVLGSMLQIANIRVLNGKLNNQFAEALGQLVTYETTEPLGDRIINIHAQNGVGQWSIPAQVPVLMGDVLGDSFSITEPVQGVDIYDENPTITGEALPGAEVSVTLTGPNGYTSTIATTADDDGNWSVTIPDSLTDGGAGDYEVRATATYPNYSPVTEETDFTFIDKSILANVVNNVVPTFDENDYRAGWNDLEDVVPVANWILNNPRASQENIDDALADLQAAIDALEKHEPNAEKITFYDGQKDLVIDFDKAITEDDNTLDLTDGFTVKVDGVEVDVAAAVVVGADGDQVKLTLADGTTLSSDSEVEVVYNKDDGNENIVGDEDHGTAVEDFTLAASDPFGKAFQIEEPEGITNDTSPTISGTVDPDADSMVVTLVGPDGQTKVIDADDITINDDGTWSYDIDETLTPGDYEVEVTTSQAGRPDVTKYQTFTVVDKSGLADFIDDVIIDLDEDDYRAGWGDLTDALNEANDLLNDPDANQDDIDAALEALEDAKAALEKHEPKVIDATFYDGEDEIIVELDKSVIEDDSQLDLTDGFTVLVDGVEVDVESAEIIGNGNQIRLTLEDGTTLSSDSEVEIIYNKDDGAENIVGDEDNGTPLESFRFSGGDSFGKAFQVESPEGITNDTSPTISGTVDPEADGMVVTLIDSDGQEIIIDEDDITINDDGTWSYDVDETLAPGDYEVIVTTSKAGRPDVTKSQLFTVVDKRDIDNTNKGIVDEDLNKDDYTGGSWAKFAQALAEAQDVINNPDASQDEVDEANAALLAAYGALVNRAALSDEVDVSDDLDESDFSPASWARYQTVLAGSLHVLNDPNATQEEIDAALAALEQAKNELDVDKSLLEKEVDRSDDLDKSDYTNKTWKAYQSALDAANKVLADPNATQSEVNAALVALEDAKAALKKAEKRVLPKTATQLYTYGLVGSVLLFLGIVLLYVTRRRVTN